MNKDAICSETYQDDEFTKREFAERLKYLREEKKLSQAELAEKLGVSRGSVSYYENCDRVPDILFLSRLCDYFGVSSNYMLGFTDNEKVQYEAIGHVTDLSDKALDKIQETMCGYALSSFIENSKFGDLCKFIRVFVFYTDSSSTTWTDEFAELNRFKAMQLILDILKDMQNEHAEFVKAHPLFDDAVQNGEDNGNN